MREFVRLISTVNQSGLLYININATMEIKNNITTRYINTSSDNDDFFEINLLYSSQYKGILLCTNHKRGNSSVSYTFFLLHSISGLDLTGASLHRQLFYIWKLVGDFIMET